MEKSQKTNLNALLWASTNITQPTLIPLLTILCHANNAKAALSWGGFCVVVKSQLCEL